MLTFTQGNLLEADVEALVNTVNTVGVMGKGIALMFKETFPENFKAYSEACKRGDLKVGKMFVTQRDELLGPRWIINFPTKQHWRERSQISWINDGLDDLVRVVREKGIRSIALPPLGCGNGGLSWDVVRQRIITALSQLDDVKVTVFEPTPQYQNAQKRTGVQKLTPARALIAETVRRYSMKGLDCSVLEVQKLAWFLQAGFEQINALVRDPLDLRFVANRYGPYSNRLSHLLDGLDGSYLHCEKRLADAKPMDLIEFNPAKSEPLAKYLRSGDVAPYLPALEHADRIVDGFQSPFGLELLATLDWLLRREDCDPTVASIRLGLTSWPGGKGAAERKQALFDDRVIGIALERLMVCKSVQPLHAAAGG